MSGCTKTTLRAFCQEIAEALLEVLEHDAHTMRCAGHIQQLDHVWVGSEVCVKRYLFDASFEAKVGPNLVVVLDGDKLVCRKMLGRTDRATCPSAECDVVFPFVGLVTGFLLINPDQFRDH